MCVLSSIGRWTYPAAITTAPPVGPSPGGHSFARARDRRIEWLLGTHPVTAAMLAALGWFPTPAKARRRLNRLAIRKRIRLVGTVCRKAGRPEHVFCRWRPKPDTLLHEVELTDVCLRLHAGRIVRGPHATDPAVRPDAELTINGRRFAVELDRDTTGVGRVVRDRFRAYEGYPHLSLWVCPTVARRDALRSRAVAIRHSALFATMAEVLADPHGPVWLDFDGGRASLPREQTPGNNPGI